VLENGVIVGRIFFLDAVGAHGRWDVGERPQPRYAPRGSGLEGHLLFVTVPAGRELA
jgi:hypothetical protein